MKTLPLLAALLTSHAAAAPAAAPARIASVAGRVELAPSATDVWETVTKTPRPLTEGDRLRTAEGASAQILLGDKSRLDIGESAKFCLLRAAPRDAAVSLDLGAVHALITKALSRHFQIKTPSAVASVRGTEFDVSVRATKDTQIEVADGVVGVQLKNGEKTELGPAREFSSLLVIPGRALSLLPHPREGSRKTGARDCLHDASGHLVASIDAVEACQARAQKKNGPASESKARTLREANTAELKRYLELTGSMPAADSAPDLSVDLPSDPAPQKPKVDEATARFMTELGLPPEAAANPAASLTPEQIDILRNALTRDGADPALKAALDSALNEKAPAQ
jgi:hypothetical protein